MIVPDVNLLVYAYNREAPLHGSARRWWERHLNARELVGLPWVVTCGFVRLMTHPRVLAIPLSPELAIAHVRSWLSRPQVRVLDPGPRHLTLLEQVLAPLGIAANLTTDAHLAAIVMEHQAELYSNDSDFGRFSGLRWRNPM